MSNVMVSIYVTTYNHENYIVRALDSILMQKTQYSYEVLVGEDCSTDNTRKVLQEWEWEHPGKFQIIYRETNTYHTDCPNGLDLKMRCKGKYIICLEGDDFWTDPEKIEKQVSFLEAHPEYYAVAHNCTVVGKDSLPNGETYPECKDNEYTLQHFASNILPGQLTTVLSRNYMTDENFDRSIVLKRVGPGDRNIYFSIASQGKIYCMQESMSAYRHITTEGSSFSATNVYSYASEQAAMQHRLDFARKIGNPEAVFCAEFQYFMHIRHAFFKRAISLSGTVRELNKLGKWCRYLPVMFKRDFRRYITHKQPYVE